MPRIVVISSSVRLERNSHRVALYFNNYIAKNTEANVEILDLNIYRFPIFEERLRFMKNPSAEILEVSEKIKNADGVVIVTPEYNGGYPAALKNFVDLLYDEWKRKPLAVVTVSDGSFGGAQVTTSLVFSLWKIGAWVVPAMFPVPKVRESFDPDGIPIQEEATNKRAKRFIDELMWCIEAGRKMNEK